MLISVVVIFYNQTQYVRRALRSVVQQTYSYLDIVVVDDGSDESIENEVNSFGDLRIRFFRKKNGGPASARNLGIKEACGQYVSFLDGDDVFLPRKIECMVELLERQRWPVCIAACGAYIVNAEKQFVGRVVPKSYGKGALINTALVRPSCGIYHADIFYEIGGFPEGLRSNEDGALNMVIAQRFPVICITEPLVLYQMDSTGLARQSLNDFNHAVSVMQERLNFTRPHMDVTKAALYKLRSHVNLLLGFLSNSNMAAARKWMTQVDKPILLRSVSGVLALVSIISGINFYLLARRIRRGLNRLLLLPVQARLRQYL